MGRLDGKVAVITGGASGIGAETVRLFAAEGALVISGDLDEERGRRVASEAGASVRFVPADVTREDDVAGLVEAAESAHGHLDCIFNNAGVPGARGGIAETDVEAWDQTIAVHLRGVFLGMKHAARVMRAQGSGSIISTGSVAGLGTGYGPHAYSAAQAAIVHLTRTVAMELGESGIRVNCICPGGIATPIFAKGAGLTGEMAEQVTELVAAGLADLQAIKRTGLPFDIAQAALWLASDDSSFVNGHALVVDGGLVAGRLWSQSPFSNPAAAPAQG